MYNTIIISLFGTCGGSEKSRLFLCKAHLLGGCIFGDSLCAFADSVFGQLSR